MAVEVIMNRESKSSYNNKRFELNRWDDAILGVYTINDEWVFCMYGDCEEIWFIHDFNCFFKYDKRLEVLQSGLFDKSVVGT